MIGSEESLESRAASRKSPFSSAAKTFSKVCGSRLRPSRHHQNVRSPTTATATMAVIRMGHMMGPPASKYFTSMFASIDRNLYPVTGAPVSDPAPLGSVLSLVHQFPLFSQSGEPTQPEICCPEIHPPCRLNWNGT